MTPLYVEVDYLGLFGDLSQEMEKNVKAAQARWVKGPAGEQGNKELFASNVP